MDVKQLKGQLSGLVSEARKLADEYKDKEMPKTVADQIAGLLGKSDALKAQIETAVKLTGLETELAQPEIKAANLGWRASAPGEGDVPFDEKSYREVEVKSIFGTKTIRYHVPIKTEGKAYANAFEAYMRKGKAGMGEMDRKTLSEGVDTAGGFLVPQDFQAELIKKMATMGVMRQLARVVTASRDSVTFPRVNHTTDDKYTSGVRMSWTGETPSSATVHRVTDPVFGHIIIPVNVAMASLPLTNSLIEDAAFDINGYSAQLLAEAFALGEDYTFLVGTGVSQPMGVTTEISATSATNFPNYYASGTSAAISTSGDAHSGKRLIDLFYTLPSQYRANAVWMMNSTTAAAVENLVDNNKRPIIRELNSISLGSGQFDSIKARPVMIDEFVPDIAANAYPILFGDMSGYTIVDRVGFSVQRNDMLYMETDITLLVARKRVGGYCTEPWKIKALKAAAS